METTPNTSSDPEKLEREVRDGDRTALASLFASHADRIKRWVELRLDPRLRGRLSASDVIQETFLAADQRLEHFRERPDMPFSVWVLLLAGQRLTDAHRRHLGAEARNAGREIAMGTFFASTSSVNIAERLATDLTSPSQAAVRQEIHEFLVQAIEAMDPLDREVLMLRHFDELSNEEISKLLDIPKGTASRRYIRALGRLREILEPFSGFLGDHL
jgi:RNA polymerase sigma-70 factor (ECF subfamily)